MRVEGVRTAKFDPSFGEPFLRVCHCHHSSCSHEFKFREVQNDNHGLEINGGIQRGREIERSKVLDPPA